MSRVYMYVVDRDFGFAPNPFHGSCTLATCKPGIQRRADVGDWIIGVGGARLNARGRCIFAMRITEKISFNEYWRNPKYLDKKPIRNGSRRMMVGDNIYHYDERSRSWKQADSHHSQPDGTVNLHNLERDTQTDQVLLSRHFLYFGNQAPTIPDRIVKAIGFRNGIGYRVFEGEKCGLLIKWLEQSFAHSLNMVTGDPFDFESSEKRYSVRGNRVI